MEKITSDNTEVDAIRSALKNVAEISAKMDPEHMIVFFRNLVIARKLQTLAADRLRETGKKINLPFLVGSAHHGIKDFLILGEEATLAGFNLFSNDTLKRIVEANGGIDAFCTTVVIPVKENVIEKLSIRSIVGGASC